jgi:hypothetical protein
MSFIQSPQPTAWTALTFYASGRRVTQGNQVLERISAGTSAASFTVSEGLAWRVISGPMGLDMTSQVGATRVWRDILWTQQGGGTITPDMCQFRITNTADAKRAAAYWIQKLITELKSLENDTHWDQSHSTIIANTSFLSKLVTGVTAPTNATVDMDNNIGVVTTHAAEWFEVIIGSDGASNLWTCAVNVALVATDVSVTINQSTINSAIGNSLYGFRMIYQTVDGQTGGTGIASAAIAGISGSSPGVTQRSNILAVQGSGTVIMPFVVTHELNF